MLTVHRHREHSLFLPKKMFDDKVKQAIIRIVVKLIHCLYLLRSKFVDENRVYNCGLYPVPALHIFSLGR